jgi:YidC/Oxa1 family membrane protein insertase
VYDIYQHIPYINNLYTEIAESMIDSGVNFKEVLMDFAKDNKVIYKGSAKVDEINKVLNSLKPEQWKVLIKSFSGSINDCQAIIKDNSSELIKIHSFIGGLNVKNVPTDKLWPGLLVPILALVSQLYSIRQMNKKNAQNKEMMDNPAMQSMKIMNTIMPLMSFGFCMSMPIGVGIYWILSSVLQIIQQFVFDIKLNKMDVDELVKQNIERASKKGNKKSYLQKLMEAQEEMDSNQGTSKTLKDYAHLSSRNYSDIEDDREYADVKEAKPGSISSYANIMKTDKK